MDGGIGGQELALSALSPTEHLWDVMDRRVRQHPHPPANQQELIEALQRERLRNPCVLIRRPMFACIEAINLICH